MVVTSAEESGFAYPYSLTVEYDPDLTDAPPATVFRLRPSRPNPFRPSIHSFTRIVFDLVRPSPATRLSIFSADGRLVWQEELGLRAAREGHVAVWDGRNVAGKLVGTGIYYCVLEAEGEKAMATLAVVRD
jgi:hypothetical protein